MMDIRPSPLAPRPWYESWFEDKRYLELYEHHDEQEADELVSLIEHTLGIEKHRKILDVACGAGRHLIAFAKRGYRNLHGYDLSPTLIEEGRTAAKSYPITFTVRDMREPIEGHYDLILNIFTSFGYFATDEENERVIVHAARALTEHGCFILDYLNRQYVMAHLVRTDERKLPGGQYVYQRREIIGGRIMKHITFDDGTEFIESVRLYEKAEIEAMFARAGLVTKAAYGSYDGEIYDATRSPRLILFGCK